MDIKKTYRKKCVNTVFTDIFRIALSKFCQNSYYFVTKAYSHDFELLFRERGFWFIFSDCHLDFMLNMVKKVHTCLIFQNINI